MVAQRTEERPPSVPEVLQPEEPEFAPASELGGQRVGRCGDGARAVGPGVAAVPAVGGLERVEIPGVDGRELGVPHLLELVASLARGERAR